MTSVVRSGLYGIRTGAEVMAAFRSLNSLLCSVDHSKFASNFVNLLSGSDRLEKFLMYLDW